MGSGGQSPRDGQPAVMGGEGAAARLATRHRDAPARLCQHADRREVHLVEPAVLHAARQQRDGAAHRDTGGRRGHLRQPCERRAAAGQHRPDAARQHRTDDRLQHRRQPDHRRVRQQPVESEPVCEPRAASACGLDLLARRLHHAAEGDVRRTDVLAGATHEAAVHEVRERRLDLRARRHRSHGGDPSSRRGRFLAGQPVGRAVRQAEPARDACRQIVGGGGVSAGTPPGCAERRRPEEAGALGQVGAERRRGVGIHGRDATAACAWGWERRVGCPHAIGREAARLAEGFVVHGVGDPRDDASCEPARGDQPRAGVPRLPGAG